MQRVPFDQMQDEFCRVLMQAGFTDDRAAKCARLFAEASRDGVYSHGLNRFPSFVDLVQRGVIDIHAEPELIAKFGILERWDGKHGPGNLNAARCMERAIECARNEGIGCVTLRNTNHWMRAGTYGLMAAEAGCIGICWTNTISLMPPWGSAECKLGNNPLVFAIPHAEGPILLDFAMSQFSTGKLGIHEKTGTPLPVPGGYDAEGNLTCDPGAVRETGRLLPIGFWKGSGLAFVLDLVVTLLSDGQSTHDISQRADEMGVSQIFIAIDIHTMAGEDLLQATIEQSIEDLCAAEPLEPDSPVRYPGKGMLDTRDENLKHGIPVDPEIWERVLAM